MGVGRGAAPPWIFLHETNKVEGGLMLIFFGLVFFRCPPPDALESSYSYNTSDEGRRVYKTVIISLFT